MSKHSILIVEDSKDIVDLLYRRFEGAYDLSFALDGKEGVAMVRRLKPDMVLLDINLPDMTGFDILKDIREADSTRNTVVLMLTCHTDTESLVRCFELGADDYILKPFNFLELSARIKSHLTIKDLQRQLMDMERLKTLHEVAVSFNHEINNPLMSISTFAHFLKANMEGDGKELTNSVEGIIEEVARISSIVNKLSAATHAASVLYGPGVNMIDFKRLTE